MPAHEAVATHRPSGPDASLSDLRYLRSEEISGHGKVGTMDISIVDQLLVTLFDKPHNVPMAMRAAGHTQDEISAAWREARRAGYTESTGLGMDRLTPRGNARAAQVRAKH